MSMPLRSLPVIQRWDCHSCCHCCREYNVAVTAEERQRISAYDWKDDTELAGEKMFVRSGWLSSRYHLQHKKDGGCVFLDADNKCKIHSRFGASAKPLACRLFPFVLTPTGSDWRLGLRFACPSVTADDGKALTGHSKELSKLVKDLSKQEDIKKGDIPAPFLQRKQRMDWPDLLRLVGTLRTIMEDDSSPVERRLRKWLALDALCREAKFDKVQGERLEELLEMLVALVDEDIPQTPSDLPAPDWVGRSLFRQQAAVYSRKDRGSMRGDVSRSILKRFMSGWRFGRGTGKVPKVNRFIRDVEFAEIEAHQGTPSAEIEKLFQRYFLVKLNSLQFFGPSHFRLPFWDGLETLVLMYPLILWLARAMEAENREQAVSLAMTIVDDHFAYNPFLKTSRIRTSVSILASRGELAKLIAWYSR